MPLTAVVANSTTSLPCGFDGDDSTGTLMDFDSPACWPSISATHSSTDYDPDPLFYHSRDQQDAGCITSSNGSKNNNNNSLAGCNKATSSTTTAGLNSTSSYCRRLGSAATSRQGMTTRPSSGFQLWSPRLRQRDERKRVLKLSLAKLRRIDDAESCLRRSVLLNNTLRRLQREARDEKTTTTTTSTTTTMTPTDSSSCSSLSTTNNQRLMGEHSNDTTTVASAMEPEACSRLQESSPPRAGIKRRRSSETTEPDALDPPSPTSASIIECLNFSDLYLPPPTPRMISSLDEVSEDESWCGGGGSPAKRSKAAAGSPQQQVGSDVNRNRPALRPCNSLPTSPTSTTSTMSTTTSSSSSCSNQNSSPYHNSLTGCTSGLSLIHSSSSSASGQSSTTTTSYSCGQSSLFGELQSVVFHSLITSLES